MAYLHAMRDGASQVNAASILPKEFIVARFFIYSTFHVKFYLIYLKMSMHEIVNSRDSFPGTDMR